MAVDSPLTGADASPSPQKRRGSKRNQGHPPVHGVKMLRRVLRSVPIDLLDKRSAIGVAARKRRQELVDQYGGADAVSPAQLILIESAVKTELILRAAEDYILRQETLIRDHALIPVVMQRQQLADSLARTLERLGLERRVKPFDLATAPPAMHREPPPTETPPAAAGSTPVPTSGE